MISQKYLHPEERNERTGVTGVLHIIVLDEARVLYKHTPLCACTCACARVSARARVRVRASMKSNKYTNNFSNSMLTETNGLHKLVQKTQ